MFAVIRTGGKQYKVVPGQELKIERLADEVGAVHTFGDVLLVSEADKIQIGQPIVSGAKVSATVISHERGPKLIVFKKIRRQGKQWKKGHRQELTRVRINEINC